MHDQPGWQTSVLRLVDVFVAPSKTFTDILSNQSWWLPFLISVIIGYGYLFAVQAQVGWDAVTVNVLKQDPKTVEALNGFVTVNAGKGPVAVMIVAYGAQVAMP